MQQSLWQSHAGKGSLEEGKLSTGLLLIHGSLSIASHSGLLQSSLVCFFLHVFPFVLSIRTACNIAELRQCRKLQKKSYFPPSLIYFKHKSIKILEFRINSTTQNSTVHWMLIAFKNLCQPTSFAQRCASFAYDGKNRIHTKKICGILI